MKSVGAKVRAVAAEIVDAVAHEGRSLDKAIVEQESRLALADRSLLRMICYGTLRRHWQLQSWIAELIEKPPRKRDRVINSLLAVGLYQLVATRIPDHAVVSATVGAARTLKRPKFAGLINACLRRFMREDMAAQETSGDEAKWNHPNWMLARLQSDWPADWQAVVAANNERAPMWLRANASRVTAGDYAARLRDLGVEAETVAGVADAVRLAAPQVVTDLPGFEAGDVSVQDAAAQIAARWLLDATPDGGTPCRVLDACAAPGGKTGHLLELGRERVQVTALDNDESRLQSVAENLERLGDDATIIAADASNPKAWWNGELFERILLDAPCSASGVIRRHPDIKLLRRESDLGTLSALQGALLAALWGVLAPGGTLLYVTCSVFAAENDEVIGQFLKDHGDAVENDVLPNNNIRDLMRRKVCGYQILPGTQDMDGFYFAALQKKKVS